MALSAKLIRAQLNFFKPFIANCSLETTRRGQDKLGELMEALHRREVIVRDETFAQFEGAWVLPRDERRQGAVLYLHGGGYTCGDLEYAKGFASTLAACCGVRVFCAAYRLAPEHRYPAALEDALEAYRYLLQKGYPARQIALCGESAGGGLAYALCLRLKQLGLPLPCGVVAISPWTDLAASGASYAANRERDPSMTQELLDFYAGCYADDRTDPLVSPLYGDLAALPPSLIFAGADEIMLDDARGMHRRLQEAGCKSQLVVAPERWHAYVLYGLKENEGDIDTIDRFFDRYLCAKQKLRWMRLDNAAKIYPAAGRREWNNVFRLSATLSQPVDVPTLQAALDVTVRRFPSIAVRLRRGAFWYYLEQIPRAPAVRAEAAWPLARMSRAELRRCAFRVVVYEARIAVEFFHALTDGTGALIFLKTLLAEYLEQRHGICVPAQEGVLSRQDEPSPAELEDSFLRYAGRVSASRREATAWHLRGTPEPDGFLHLTRLSLPVGPALQKAHEYGVSLTAFLCGVMLQALLEMQREQVREVRRRRPVKVLLPVNLRRLFPSSTLRNFALYTTPSIDPKLGEWSFEEILQEVHHRMGMEASPKFMSARIATNVSAERVWLLKIMPLFIKNIAMRAVFNAVGERKSCLCLSNLGAVQLPEVMRPYVREMDFILGTQARAPHNCGVLSYDGMLRINFIRNIRESDLEAHFFAVLHRLGLGACVQSNHA